MIYYYFGGKEALYLAVLESAYAAIREAEQRASTSTISTRSRPSARLAELTFDHHEAHPDFIRLVSIENIHRGEHIARSSRCARSTRPRSRCSTDPEPRPRRRASSATTSTPSTCTCRSAPTACSGSPTATPWRLFDRDLLDPALRERYRTMLGDMVVAYLTR